MIGSTITITINAVAKTLNRVNDSEPYSATYFLAEATRDYTATIKHTIPTTRGASKESHLVRLDIVDYDADGVVTKKQSAWTVLEASIGSQNTTDLGYFANGLMDFLDATVLPKVLARQS
jgi:hypothetical protein